MIKLSAISYQPSAISGLLTFKFVLFLLVLSSSKFGYAQNMPNAPYKNPKLANDLRVKDLLSRMTLEEKVAQMWCHWESQAPFKIVNAKGEFDEELLAKRAPNGLGQVGRPGEGAGGGALGKGYNAFETATFANKIQKYFVEKTRLGIPVMFHEESLHGNQTKDATAFPTHLALGSTWNEALVTEVYTKIAEEVRLRGGHQVLAPVVDLGRDPRWGRTEETLGEDPYHVSRMSVAEIKAYQGGANVENIPARHVMATLKHFGVHGASEGGLNIAPSFVDERTLREVYFPSFKACVEVGAKSLMPCYNELSGIPAHSNKWLLTDVLRKEWGFKGTVVSDYFAVANLHDDHLIANTSEEAAKWAVEAGVDVETPNFDKYATLVGLVKSGKVAIKTIDEIVTHVLLAKFQMGLFENPYTDADEAKRVVGCAENRKVALKAAQESMVLLKNNKGILPLKKGAYKKIALVGPNADRCILGGYADVPKQTISPLQALKEKAKGQFDIIYAEGVHLTDTGDWFAENNGIKVTDPAINKKNIKLAVEAVRDADIILYFGGANEVIYREGWSMTHSGDRPDIDLYGEQNELILALKALKKPMVGFVFSGPPLACKTLDDNVDALVQCWFLGQETGDAVADLILGNINPSGKLPITIPRSAGHIPAYYSYKPSAKRGYNLAETTPLYPFGHGLSYTTFSYEHLALSHEQLALSHEPSRDSSKLKAHGSKLKAQSSKLITVSVDVTNSGAVEGAEVVQLYIRDVVSSVTRPIKELKDFSKITLKPGEKKTVTFTITPDKLSFYNREMKKVVEPGDFEVMVGTSSMDNQTVKFTITE